MSITREALHFKYERAREMQKSSMNARASNARSMLTARSALIALSGLVGCAAAGEDELDEHEASLLAQSVLPQSVEVESVTATGSGCPGADSYNVVFAADRSTFTIEFKDFDVSTAPRSGFDLENCSYSVKIKGKEGVAYAPVAITMRTNLGLSRGTTATVGTDAYWVGVGGPNATSSTSFNYRNVKEPQTGSVFRTASDNQQIWSGCNGDRELRITNHLSVSGSYRNSEITQGSAKLVQVRGLTFATKRCQTTEPQPSLPQVEEVKATGPSCPTAASTSIEISPDKTSFKIRFNDFAVAVDAGTQFRRATCDVYALIKAPPGHAYTLEGYSGDGAVSLQEGVTLSLTRSYRFLGGEGTETRESILKSTTLVGPIEQAVRIEDKFASEEGEISGCLGGTNRYSSENVFVSLGANLTNSTPRRAGSFKLNQLGEFRFALRPCQAAAK